MSRSSAYSVASAKSLLTSPLIAEDEFKPTPFLRAIMELVNIIGHVVSMPAHDMLRPMAGHMLDEALDAVAADDEIEDLVDERSRIAALMPTEFWVQRLTEIGDQWLSPSMEDSNGMQPWPCRGLFLRSLLAISSLNRIVMWYGAVRSMYSEDIVDELDRRSELIRKQESGADADEQALHIDFGAMNLGTAGVPDFGSQILETPAEMEVGTPNSGLPVVLDGVSVDERQSSIYSNDPALVTISSSPDQPSQAPRWAPGVNPDPNSLQNAATADKGLNMLMEVSLDGHIRYVSPAWRRLIGSDPEALVDQPVGTVIMPSDILVCRSAVEQLLADKTRTVEIGFSVCTPTPNVVVHVEAKGMLIYHRLRDEPSHILWVLRYIESSSPRVPSPPYNSCELSTDSSDYSTMSRSHSQSSRKGSQQTSQQMSPSASQLGPLGQRPEEFEIEDWMLPRRDDGVDARGETTPPSSPLESITCRICDRAIPAAYFEEHTWLCARSHRAAMDVEQQNDKLSDIKTKLHAWYPGCSIIELEELVHGETDAADVHQHAELQAAEIGSPMWETLVGEASEAISGLSHICYVAMTLDTFDATPKCDIPEEGSNTSSISSQAGDFIHSESWLETERFKLPELTFVDPCFDELAKAAILAMRAKRDAIDSLQYAIIEASIACSRWLIPVQDIIDEVAPVAAAKLPMQSSPAPAGVLAASASDSSSTPHPGGIAQRLSSANIVASASVSPNAASVEDDRQDTSEPETSPKSSPLAFGSAVPSSIKPAADSSSQTHNSPGPLRITTSSLHPSKSHIPSTVTMGMGSSASYLATPTIPSINDFVLLKPISKGAYGSVFLAKKRTTGEYYAIKILKKADMIAKNQISNVKAERAIMMAQTGSPFVVRLLFTFQSRTNLYLVMEYLNGGDCASLLKSIGALPEDWAKQYLAEVVLGIEDLHGRNVVHRDLKPDNLLIDCDGHLKLTDFGLSKLGFLGRRVDQQSLANNQHLSNSQGDDASGHSELAAMEPISTGRVWQPYVANPVRTPQQLLTETPLALRPSPVAGSSDLHAMAPMAPSPINLPPSSTDYFHQRTQTAMPLPSIATPPPMKRELGEDPSSPSAPMTSKRVSMLREAVGPPGLDSPGASSTTATSSSSGSASSCAAVPSDAGHTHTKRHALGTPDYIAPESILGLESGESVDWWALGVICYEFLFGVPPFHDETPEKVFQNILSADIDFYDEMREKLRQEKRDERQLREEHKMQAIAAGMPVDDGDDDGDNDEDDDDDVGIPEISSEARDFISKLLTRDPKRRLGYNGAAEVKSHPFFQSVNWDMALDAQPAFVPQVDDIEDTEYFDSRGATLDESHKEEEQEKQEKPKSTLVVPAQASISSTKSEDLPPLTPIKSAPLQRYKTTPARLSEEPETPEDISCEDISCEEPRAIPIAKRTKDEDDVPALEDDPEFGGFTFKNLHALEQANFNEIIKLRRRSTLMDIANHPLIRSDTQSSTAHSSTLETPPSMHPVRRHGSFLTS
ncbi:rim15, signal transduction response regulator, partial [Linderina pennispora]